MHLISFAPTWFMQGLLHPLQTPSHILLILGLGFLLGQQHKILGASLLIFSATVIAGLFGNQLVNIKLNYELILLSLALIVSLLVIAKLSLPKVLIIALVMISGITLGFNSSPILIPGLGSTSIYNWRFGAATSFIGIVMLITFIAYFLSKWWNGIVLRVLGSWIATSTIFVITFLLFKT